MTELALELDGDAWSPGDTVTGTVSVTQGGGSRALTVALHFCERADVYFGVARRVEAPAPLHTGELTRGMRLPFAITLPPDAPPPYTGEHGRLFWIVEATSDERGRDAHARLELEVRGASTERR